MDRKIEKKKWTLKRIGLWSGIALLPVLLVYSIFGADYSSKLAINKETTSISEVKKGDFAEYISVDGSVLPLESIYIDAVEGGVVENILVEDGSTVKQGDVLLTLSNANLQLDYINRETQILDLLNQIESTRLNSQQSGIKQLNDLADLKYQLKTSELKYATQKMLNEGEATSRNDFAQSRDENAYLREKMQIASRSIVQDSILRQTQIRQMNMTASRMQQNLETVKNNMQNLIVKAPISGQLTNFDTQKGQLLQKGQNIAQIDVTDGFKIRVQIDEHYIARIVNGQAGTFDFDGKSYSMTIKKVYPQVKNGFFAAEMVFDTEIPSGIRKGQNASVRLALSTQVPALLLERGSFAQQTGGNWVFVLDADGKTARKRTIRVGRQNPQYFELLEGLRAGEKVITSSYAGYEDKDKLLLK
jgi:HlyD family secretion protein